MENRIKIPCTVVLILSILMLFSSCIEFKEPFDKLPPGHWRGVLYLDQQSTFRPGSDQAVMDMGEMRSVIEDNQLPFNFEIIYDEDGEMYALFYNAGEKLKVTDIAMRVDLSIAKDTVKMRFPGSDNYLKALYAENVLQGFWVVPSKGNYQIPFEAHYGEKHRFELPINRDRDSIMSIAGIWSATFSPGEESERTAIAEFTQSKEQVSGTFLTNTGDYRYLDGVVEDDKLWLSSFDGVNAYLFGAKKNEGGILEGFFKSGRHYETQWKAVQSDENQLSDPTTMSKFLFAKFTFSATDLQGEKVTEEQFVGRPTVIYLTGTWCPNCRDATNLLKELAQEYDIQVIGLAFERYRDQAKALSLISNYREDFNLNYPILLAGYMDKREATENLGMVEEIIAYPTVIFLHSDFSVSGSYTGFSGPATSRYESLVGTFHSEINKILSHE